MDSEPYCEAHNQPASVCREEFSALPFGTQPATCRLREDLRVAALWLRWTCLGCGWTQDLLAPKHPGDGRTHLDAFNAPCGPLLAQRCSTAPIIPTEKKKRSEA